MISIIHINRVLTFAPFRHTFQLYEPCADLHRAVVACTEAAIMASTGNSGTALSSFFVTLCSALEGKSNVSVSEFATALRSTGGTIGSAFPPDKVKEGTIVSVIRKSVQLSDDDCSSLQSLAVVWESRALKALYETPDELEVDGHFILKEAAEKVSLTPLGASPLSRKILNKQCLSVATVYW